MPNFKGNNINMLNASLNKENDMSTSDIEKKSLEAHVELCAERYAALDKSYTVLNSKMEIMTSKVERLESHIMAIREAIASSGERHTKQLLTIGTAIGTVLITGLISVFINFINK